MKTTAIGCVLVGVLAGSVAADDGVVTILDSGNTYWRWVKASRPAAVIPDAPDAGELKTLGGKTVPRERAAKADPALPDGWTAVTFDDSRWPRTSSALLSSAVTAGHETGLARLRGTFAVTDPAAVKSLSLTLTYRGGVVVYLNGTEIARGGLPDGDLMPGTPAIAYPLEAYLDAQGKIIPHPYHLARRIKAGETDLRERAAKRDRALGPIAAPVNGLRKGLNVLALELHRSDFRREALQWRGKSGTEWPHIQLGAISLTAAGSGVTPNNGRPTGLQVWNADRNDRLSGLEYGDPNEPLRPIELVGPRNGVTAARVVVSSTEAIQGLKATVGEMKGPTTIPAQHVTVFYEMRSINPWFCRLTETPPGDVPVYTTKGRRDTPAGAAQRRAAMQPVWVSVEVPRTSRPGNYTGTLTIDVTGAAPVLVPVRLHVANWISPGPRGFRTTVALYQSPTTLAKWYTVPMWS